jgi:hypothetical protein
MLVQSTDDLAVDLSSTTATRGGAAAAKKKPATKKAQVEEDTEEEEEEAMAEAEGALSPRLHAEAKPPAAKEKEGSSNAVVIGLALAAFVALLTIITSLGLVG